MGNVEIKCKTIRKSLCNFIVKIRANLLLNQNPVQTSQFPPSFPTFFTHFHTTNSHLFLSNTFHYSTAPTNTTTNNLIERTLL